MTDNRTGESTIGRIDAICDHFENSWLSGQRPQLEQFVALAGPDDRGLLLLELLRLELHYRRKAGETPELVDYLGRFPGHEKLIGEQLYHLAVAHTTAGHSPRTFDPLAPPPTVTHVLPATVPGYEILGLLGRGGMGMVCKARHITLKRLVALKMILAGPQAAEHELSRFRAEAEVVARLRHPNIVQIYEVGEVADESGAVHPFMALELVEGGSLARQLNGTPQAPRQAAELIEVLARAVQVAHEAGVVHRDLKPANVLLTPDNVPKIADFGLAKRLDAASLTQSGLIVGTPSYMAPEQAAGKNKEVGPPADIYALGALLYELLTGRAPFKGASIAETLAQVVGNEPVSPRRLNQAAPLDLETICLKCLRKEPHKRYQSAAELADDLRRFLDGRPVAARPVSAWERALKWARRRPAQAALAAALVLAVLGGVASALFYGLYNDQRAAVLERDRAQLEKRLERREKIEGECNAGQREEDAGQLQLAKAHWDRALNLLDAEPGSSLDDLRGRIEEHCRRLQRLLDEKKARAEAESEAILKREDLRKRQARFRKHADEVLTREISVTDRSRASDVAVIRHSAPAALKEFGLTAQSEREDAARALEPYRPYFDSPQQRIEVAATCYSVLLVWAEAEATPLPDQPPASHQAGLQRARKLLDLAEALGKTNDLKTPRALHVRRARYLTLLGEESAARAQRQLADRVEAKTALDLFLTALDDFRHGELSRAAHACEAVLQQEADHFWAQYLHALCRMREGKSAEAKAGLTGCLRRRPNFFWARLLRAIAHSQVDDETDAAEKDFTVALDQADDNLERWFVRTNRGVLWARRKQWDKALVDLKEAIGLQPDAYQPYVSLVRAYEGLHQQWRAAVGVVAGGVPWVGAGLQIVSRQGGVHRKELDEIVTALGQALKRRPNDAWLYHVRAQFHLLRGGPKLARDDFKQAIAHEPREGTSPRLADDYVELGRLQHRAGEYQAALDSFAAALRVVPDYPSAHRHRAETLLKLGGLARYREARKALELYLKKGKPTWEVYHALGLILVKLENYPEAVDAFRRALSLKRDPMTLRTRGWIYLKLNATVLALQDFEDAVRLNPTDGEALCGRGLARARLRQAGALEDALAALRHGPRTPHLLLNLACVHSRVAGQLEATLGRTPDAIREMAQEQERAVELVWMALRQLQPDQRSDFWRENIRPDADLVPIRHNPDMLELARRYARQP